MGLNNWMILLTDIVEKIEEEVWLSNGDMGRNRELGFRYVEF